MAGPPRRRPSHAAAERDHNDDCSDTEQDLPPPYPDRDLVASSIFQPRIAVVLKVPERWHAWLFFGRLLSIFPAIFYAIQPLLTLAVQIVPLAVPGGMKAADAAAAAAAGGNGGGTSSGGAAGGSYADAAAAAFSGALVGVAACPPSSWPPGHPEIPFPWTEMSLGLMWVWNTRQILSIRTEEGHLC